MRRRTRRRLMLVSRGLLTGLALLGCLTTALGVPLPQLALPLPEQPAAPSAKLHPCGCPIEEETPCCCGPKTCCSAATPDSPEPPAGVLIGELVRQCRGQERLAVSGPIALPPGASVCCSALTPAHTLAISTSAQPHTPSLRPPAPPPRAA